MATKQPQLKKSTKYDEFVNDITNRDIRKTNKLEKSMRKYGFLPSKPIQVVRNATKWYVKDGFHRLHVARSLEIPFYYVEDETNISIPEINDAGGGAWSLGDYVASYVRQGNPEYLELKEFQEQYKLPMTICASLLWGEQAKSANAGAQVRSGAFRVRNREYALQVVGVVSAIRQYTKLATNSFFIQAISKCCFVTEFDEVRFIRHCARCSGLIQPQPNLDGWMDVCERVYNDRMSGKNKIPLAFYAKQASDSRSPFSQTKGGE